MNGHGIFIFWSVDPRDISQVFREHVGSSDLQNRVSDQSSDLGISQTRNCPNQNLDACLNQRAIARCFSVVIVRQKTLDFKQIWAVKR